MSTQDKTESELLRELWIEVSQDTPLWWALDGNDPANNQAIELVKKAFKAGEAAQRESVLSDVGEWAEKSKQSFLESSNEGQLGYNQALSDLQSHLTKLKEEVMK